MLKCEVLVKATLMRPRNCQRRCVLAILVSVMVLLPLRLFTRVIVSEGRPRLIYMWPPSDIREILSYDKKSYNITIGLRLTHQSLANPSSPKTYLLRELFRINESQITVTFVELPYYMSKYGGLIRYPDIYQTYPQDVPMKKLVAQIKSGLPVDVVSNFDNLFPSTFDEY